MLSLRIQKSWSNYSKVGALSWHDTCTLLHSVWWNTKDLVGRLNLSEMIDQMAHGGADNNGASGYKHVKVFDGYSHLDVVVSFPGTGPAPAIARLGIKPYQWGTECISGDVWAGNATSFPMSIGLVSQLLRFFYSHFSPFIIVIIIIVIVLVNNECSSWYNRVGDFLLSVWNRRKQLLYIDGSACTARQNNPTSERVVNVTECSSSWLWLIYFSNCSASSILLGSHVWLWPGSYLCQGH